MFTVDERDAARERVLQLARDDRRVVAGALVGSLAAGSADAYSDIDMTFAVSDDVAIPTVLDDWTRAFGPSMDALPLVNLERMPTTYRVFLLPNVLQFDLSMTPAAEFRPAGPRFKLLFGETAPALAPPSAAVGTLSIATPAVPRDVFGWGAIYALHARACIERRRPLQAEHYVAAVRDHALSLAAFREDTTPFQARGYDDLSPGTRARFEGSHVGELEQAHLRSALGVCVSALLHEGAEADLPHASIVAERLIELC
jgi:plasmid stabilization system protein ParE